MDVFGQIRCLQIDGVRIPVVFPGRGIHRSRPSNRLGGCIEKLKHSGFHAQTRVDQLHQRDTESKAVQTGKESSLNHADHVDLVITLELAVDFVCDTGELERADAAEIVD